MAKASKTICEMCGHSHAALNVRIAGRVLHRTVKSTRHFIYSRNAYGFSPKFWDSHAKKDFDAVRIEDQARGEVWRGDRRAIESATHETLAPAIGLQVILRCDQMAREGAPKVEHNANEHTQGKRAEVKRVVPIFGHAEDFIPKAARKSAYKRVRFEMCTRARRFEKMQLAK
jgi:hypothetical protein